MFSASMEERSRDSIRAVVNLALLSGNLGKPGAGLFALTEQNNLQGVCDMGMLPDRLPGYRLVTDDQARSALDALWKSRIATRTGAWVSRFAGAPRTRQGQGALAVALRSHQYRAAR